MLANEGYTDKDIQSALLDLNRSDKDAFLPLNKQDKIFDMITEVSESSSSIVEEVQKKLNPLRIENTFLTKKGNYIYYYGSIKNYGDKTYYFVKVRAVFMDSEKNVLTTDWTYAVGSEGIRPNENVQFEIMKEVRGNVEYGKLEIYEYQ